jgi:hypothetical protein
MNEVIVSRVPMARFAKPNDIARVVAFGSFHSPWRLITSCCISGPLSFFLPASVLTKASFPPVKYRSLENTRGTTNSTTYRSGTGHAHRLGGTLGDMTVGPRPVVY